MRQAALQKCFVIQCAALWKAAQFLRPATLGNFFEIFNQSAPDFLSKTQAISPPIRRKNKDQGAP